MSFLPDFTFFTRSKTFHFRFVIRITGMARRISVSVSQINLGRFQQFASSYPLLSKFVVCDFYHHVFRGWVTGYPLFFGYPKMGKKRPKMAIQGVS